MAVHWQHIHLSDGTSFTNASTAENTQAASETPEPAANTKNEAKPSASQPVFLVVGVFIALAILAWIIL